MNDLLVYLSQLLSMTTHVHSESFFPNFRFWCHVIRMSTFGSPMLRRASCNKGGVRRKRQSFKIATLVADQILIWTFQLARNATYALFPDASLSHITSPSTLPCSYNPKTPFIISHASKAMLTIATSRPYPLPPAEHGSTSNAVVISLANFVLFPSPLPASSIP